MLLWISMGSSLMRVNALIGAPMRSGPYSGMACMYWSAESAVSATTLAAVTAPWPARACQRISVSCMAPPFRYAVLALPPRPHEGVRTG